MKGKVTCTCGWSWNKSDSSKKDMYICHECGRDNSNNMKNGGWLDNYGTQENYNDYKVSAPEGMVGDGYSNVGRNYSPAWGGQFQSGGSIPGSVGFTYARTKGIPSNGPYAKKTLPSAQNGQEMRYYQNGLDWKPKGMKDGGWLDAYKEGGIIKDDRGQWEHPGEITEINSPYITMQGVPYDVLGISDTGDTKLMKPGKDYKFKGKKVTEFPVAQKGKKVSGGLGIEDWWNNRKEIQSTYRMANEVDPFMKNWMNNPITQKRLNDQIGYLMEDNKKPINVINENLNTLPVYDQKKMRGKKTSDFISNYKLQNDLGSEYPDSQFEVYFNNLREEPYVAGSYVPDIHSMSVADINDKGTLVHEMTHGSGIQDEMEHYMQFKYNQKPDPNYPEGSYKKNDYDYLKRDGMYPRIMDIRRELNLKPGQKVDKRIFNGNNIKTDSAIQDLREMYDDDEILHIMNTIADNSKSKKLSTAKNGLRQEQKGLVNLDNLLNFTNYNTKQPGGWLDTL